jgi:hypothetical protein
MRLSILASTAILLPLAQQGSAQTVQLPTFSFFSVSTTVSVPDNGSAFMGGINRAASGGNEFGVPGLAFPGLQNRSFGQDMSASSVWAKVTIHDFDAMDQAILNTPSPNDLTSFGTRRWDAAADVPAVPRVAASFSPDAVNLAGNWRSDAPAAPTGSKVAAEENDREARRAARSAEAESYFARGQKAESDGKPSVAKIYYQMAARRASGDLKQQAQARLDALSGRSTALAKNSQ